MNNHNDGAQSGPAVRCSAWLGGILTVYPPSPAQWVVVKALKAECLGEQPTQAFQRATNSLSERTHISAAEWRMETEETLALLAHCSDSEGSATRQKGWMQSRWLRVCATKASRTIRAIGRAIHRLARTAYKLHQWCLYVALRLESSLRDAPATVTPKLCASESRASVAESREAARGQSHPMSLAYGSGVAMPPNAAPSHAEKNQ